MSSTTLLSLGNLSVWYTANHPVLSDFSLDLGTNEVVGLIGLNGAGKTTFIKTVAGLLSGYHQDSAVWEGQPFAFRDKAFKRSRYIVFAEDRSFQYFTFREYLTYVAASYGVPLPDVSDLIRGFHFEDYANVLLSVADLLPLPAIALARGVAAREMLVLPLRFLAMLLTVLLAVLAKVRAAGVAAGASWFSRHACRLLSDNRKAPKGLLL